MYMPTTGRFNKLDPFLGDFKNPQSLHKYGYVHGDPVNGIDPTGEFFTLAGLAVGISASRSQQGFYNKAVAMGGRTALGFLLDNIALVTWLRLSVTARDGTVQLPQRQYANDVRSNTNYVRIEGASITADQAFQRILQFNRTDYPDSPAKPVNSVSNIGDKLTWTMPSFPHWIGQVDFDVRVDQLDHTRRFVSVVTLGGHPLSGFRFWEVQATSGSDTNFTIVTGAVEHNTTWADAYKANIGAPAVDWPPWDNGNWGVLRTWESLLNTIVGESGGTVNSSQSLVEGKWDDSLINNFKTKVNWRYVD